MIIFEKIRWKNFLSYGNSFTEIDLCKDRKTILLGDSGSGKSTFLDALKFVCFNKPYRNITKPQLVNTINNKDCVVEVELRKGKKQYKIVRGIKPNIFEIYCDGNLINQDSNVRDYQLIFEKNILGFNARSFDQIVVVGASNFTPFMQLKPQDRRIIIEELLDLQIFGVMNNLLKDKISNLKKDQETLLSEMELCKEKMKIHKKFIEDLEKNRQEQKTKINKELSDKKNHRIEIEKEKEIFILKKDELLLKIKDESDVNIKIKKLNNVEYDIKNRISRNKKEISFFKEHETCNTCHQQINEKIKIETIDKLEKNSKELEDNLEKIKPKIEKLLEIKTDIENTKNEIAKVESSIYANEQLLQSIDKDIQNIENELSNLNSPTKNITSEKNILKNLFEEYKDKEKLTLEHKDDKVIYDTAQDLLRDSGVKSQIIKQYLPLINKNTNKFLSSMNFFSTFYIDENFNEFIKSRGFDDFSYASFSEGEKQRIDLALLFTWRVIAKMKNSVGTNLLVMDEIFDSYLDIEATEYAIDILNSSLFKNLNIFVISHKNTIADKFDNKLEFEKVKNFSRIK